MHLKLVQPRAGQAENAFNCWVITMLWDNMSKKTFPPTIQLAILAVFTSLVCAATMVFSISVPATKGFFNIGEIMVYITALLFGPFIGSFAGGFGSMLADILLSAPQYAPGTLIIKACEGGIVGFLGRKKPSFGSRFTWKAFTFVVGLIFGVLFGSIGALYYSGPVVLYLGIPPPESPTMAFFVPQEFWYVLGALVVFSISLVGFVFEAEFGWMVLTVLVGGFEMIVGYYLYEQILYGTAAIAEIPINIGQVMVGLVVSIPVVRAVWRALPSLKLRK